PLAEQILRSSSQIPPRRLYMRAPSFQIPHHIPILLLSNQTFSERYQLPSILLPSPPRFPSIGSGGVFPGYPCVSVCMGLDVGEIGMPLDLGLDLKLFVAKTAGRLAAAAKEAPAVDACIRGLEEERRKIEVFRRELPLCARLLADGG
uniref:HHO5-like N-terminal domain-containing protein n=1 Tax=Aegilops tauschii subsp. strangulata TaxID=200361 RepID=A0A453LW86_AEGTS